jgi:hypothetical protein
MVKPMKLTAIIIALLFCLCGQGQNLVVYSDSSKPVAIRLSNGTWKISNPQKALEHFYQLYNKLNEKYQAALLVLKWLNPQGCPTDNKSYIKAVANYNQLISR